MKWRKSSCSGDNGGNCVELADLNTTIAIRDSKNPNADHLIIDRTELADLIDHIKTGDLDL